MDPDFWLSRWKEGNIGWHLDQVNPFLIDHWPKLNLPDHCHVLVPCCGKSLDMIYLARLGHQVTGLELSELAVTSFFSENNLSYSQSQRGPYQVYKAHEQDITLWLGDMFAIQKNDIPEVKAIYDRAAIIALTPEQRQHYAKLLGELASTDCQMLLLSLEFDQEKRSPPPHSVMESEIRQLFGEAFEITLNSRENILEQNEKFKQAGVTQLDETCFFLSRK